MPSFNLEEWNTLYSLQSWSDNELKEVQRAYEDYIRSTPENRRNKSILDFKTDAEPRRYLSRLASELVGRIREECNSADTNVYQALNDEPYISWKLRISPNRSDFDFWPEQTGAVSRCVYKPWSINATEFIEAFPKVILCAVGWEPPPPPREEELIEAYSKAHATITKRVNEVINAKNEIQEYRKIAAPLATATIANIIDNLYKVPIEEIRAEIEYRSPHVDMGALGCNKYPNIDVDNHYKDLVLYDLARPILNKALEQYKLYWEIMRG